ncbi:MAG: MBL fold metallo-hydrolase [Chloroflexi bacterium]|nr:MAG: MBL fold metallo-hydrolase [Chloroflexota bacterium]
MPLDNRITYLGHATVLLEMNGARILTDPILRDRVFHLQRRSLPVDAAQYQNIDAVLISHLHWDHFDLPSLRLLGRDAHLIVPAGAAGLLNKQGYRNVVEMHPGDTTGVGRLAIQATYADHDARVFPGVPPADCLGFLVKGAATVYFAGDTDLFPAMADLAGGLDLALLGVWGWGPNLGKKHMDPTRAAEALALLRPRIAVPIHWGTFYPRWLSWLRPHLMTDPPLIFRREAEKRAPEVQVEILAPGASFQFTESQANNR